nr:hypothetical protein [Lysinibacillus timonensis]
MYSKEELERLRIEGQKIADEMQREKEESTIGREYKANEIEVSCVHCKHNKFEQSKALLNTRGLTFFDIEWLNDSATTLLCKRCGFIHWFRGKVEEIKND